MQLPRKTPEAVLVVVVSSAIAAGLVALQLLCMHHRVHGAMLVKDPAMLAGLPFYTGALSNLGIAGWGTGAGIALFGWTLLRRDHGQRELAGLLLGFALLTGWVFLDDMLQLHEDVLPNHLNLPEGAVVGLEFALGSWWLVRYRRLLLARAFWPIAFAVVGFGLHPVLDNLPASIDPPAMIEDGIKLIGIVNWAIASAVLTRAGLAAPAPARAARAAVERPAEERAQHPAFASASRGE